MIDIIKTSFISDTKIIIDSILEFNPISIILYGGYGRGEGSWVKIAEKKYTPYNDYDILIIYDKKLASVNFKKLASELARDIGIRWIDIGQITINNLCRYKPSIYSYDLKYGSKVIYGDKNILLHIPDYKSSDLSLKEGEILFFTRLWTLLGSLDQDAFRVELKDDQSRFFRNQMAKAILAVVDILLLQKGLYHTSYKSRVERLTTYYSHRQDIIDLANWALEEKLLPKSPLMSPQEVKKLYTTVHKTFISEMYKVLSMYYHFKVDSPNKIAFLLKWSPKNLIYRLAWLVLKRNKAIERKIAINLAQSYIVSAFGQTNNNYLAKGIKYLQYCVPSFPSSSSWDDTRIKISQIRLGG